MGGGEGEIRRSPSFRSLWVGLGCTSFRSSPSLCSLFVLCQGLRATFTFCDGRFQLSCWLPMYLVGGCAGLVRDWMDVFWLETFFYARVDLFLCEYLGAPL